MRLRTEQKKMPKNKNTKELHLSSLRTALKQKGLKKKRNPRHNPHALKNLRNCYFLFSNK